MNYLFVSQIFISILFIKFYKFLPVLITKNKENIHTGGYFFALSLLNYSIFSSRPLMSEIEIIIFPLFAFLIGAYDDRFSIKPFLRILLISTLVILLINFSSIYNINFLIFEDKIYKIISPYNIFFTCLCFLLLINALNFSDGINCLAGLIFLFLFFYLGIGVGANIELVVTIILAIIPFLILNWKNKCFLGDSGVYLLGFLISQIIILSYKDNYQTFQVEEIFMLLYLPGFDLFRLFLDRLFKKQNPFKGDNNHIHHLLAKKIGFKKTLILFLICLAFPLFLYKLVLLNNLLCILSCIIIYSALFNYAKN